MGFVLYRTDRGQIGDPRITVVRIDVPYCLVPISVDTRNKPSKFDIYDQNRFKYHKNIILLNRNRYTV